MVGEKYPDSWRLDHPDFGDVGKTTFAKGVISDFQKISDDPLKVKSLVKVDVEGYGESGYIPLFYHPKAQYWDNDDALATDYNEENGFFEKAWMSFRAGDEVVVLFRARVPYAVIGFVDGKPRIGENIIRFQVGGNLAFGRCIPFDLYGSLNEEQQGPDGKELGLTLNGELIANGEQSDEATEVWDWSGYEGKTGCWPPWNLAEVVWGFTQNINQTNYTLKEWMVKVGPLLWVFQFIQQNDKNINRGWFIQYLANQWACEYDMGIDPPFWNPTGPPEFSPAPDNIWPDGGGDIITENFYFGNLRIFIGIYTKELEKQVKQEARAHLTKSIKDVLDGLDEMIFTDLVETIEVGPDAGALMNAITSDPDGNPVSWDSMDMKVRPHN